MNRFFPVSWRCCAPPTARRHPRSATQPASISVWTRERRHCVERLEARLASSPRSEDDWSLAPPDSGCGCDLCDTLAAFLAAPDQSRFEWPLAKERRKHVHRILDRHELPVHHETRRKGRPYTLVLTKTNALFEREAAERKAWQADLDRLTPGSGR